MKLLLSATVFIFTTQLWAQASSGGDPCDMSALAARLHELQNDDSSAADSEKLQISEQLQAKAKECLNTASTPDSAGVASSDSPNDSSPKQDKAEADRIAREVGDEAANFVKSLKEAVEIAKGDALPKPFELLWDSLNSANTAAGGDIPSSMKSIDLLASVSKSEQDLLDGLASKSTNDWIEGTSYNLPDAPSHGKAQRSLDDVSDRLARIKRLNEGLLPSLESAQKFLSNDAVNSTRMALAESTLVGLDPLALQDVISRLNNCSYQIDNIQRRLHEARAVLY